jgi:hypothetical protein
MSTPVKTIASVLFICVVSSFSCFGNISSPGNDNFADRFTLTGASGTANGDNIGATHEVDEPWIIPAFINGTNSVWWTWTCPATGLYGFDTIGSSFHTALGIFTGDSLVNLKKVIFSTNLEYYNGTKINRGYVYFNATAGQVYQISISGRQDSDEGTIIINWYPDVFVAYKNVYPTNYYYKMIPAYNGSILQTHMLNYTHLIYSTNIKEIVKIDYDNQITCTNVTVIDAKKRKVVDTDAFPAITGKIHSVSDFDGKRILVVEHTMSYSDEDGYVHLYAVGKKGLEHINTYYVSNNFGSAFFSKKWIYLYYADWSYVVNTKIAAMDKNLKKVVWEYTPSLQRGAFSPVYPNGVAVYQQWDVTTDFFFEISKKGKQYGTHTITRPDTGFLTYKFDDKGGILYWINDNGTNSPLTYLDRKNNEMVAGFNPDNFSLFNRWDFDGKTLILGKSSGSTNVFRTYKWGKNPKLNGEITVTQCRGVILADNKFHVITTNVNTIAVAEYDKRLKKVKWQNSGPGDRIEYLGKNVFLRERSSGTITILTFFKKGKVIVEHVVDKPNF